MDSLKYKILQYNSPTPRYTSYPPATQFQTDFPAADYTQSIKSAPSGASLSLYIHIPFCTKLCYYCGCLTYATKRPERISHYLDLLKKEAALVAKDLPAGAVVEHLHFGGGSPTMLSAQQFESLMYELRRTFPISVDAEIAIEADPRQISEAKIAAYAKTGVTRMSFGVQDFDQTVMTAVNREQPLRLTLDALRLCRSYGIHDINIDLMYGLPHQTVKSISETVNIATGLSPTRVAFFGYAHVPWMKKHMTAMDMQAMPSPELRYDLFQAGSAILSDAGYESVGIDHFVRSDDSMARAWHDRSLHRNFQGYTTDNARYLVGLGVSAISKTPEMYAQNHTDIREYENTIQQGTLPTRKGRIKSSEDIWVGEVIEQIMCYQEVDLARIRRKFHLNEAEFFPALERLAPLLAEEMVFYKDEFLHLSPHASLLTRLVASAFDRYTIWGEKDHLQRHAKTV